jgi:hypothetical protein
MNLAMAIPMDKSQVRQLVRAAVFLGNHMMDLKFFAVFEPLMTDETETLLSIGELPRAIRQGLGSAPALSPVVL